MKRARAQALALVNWRGLFYRSFELDPNVTALEGVNGAGKTTVMIAAYLVLLPDMSRLRFTNVGEHGATGGDKGIWGRLGNPDAPSYAFLDIRLARGERLLAGVHLERRAEPNVEPTPLLVTDLAEGITLQEVLLDRGEDDRVPDRGRLRELVARAGGRLITFQSAKEYFAALFDRGVTPLRLAADEERTKFNEMLRTSMTGGISRALTSELRGFLLRKETGLADSLAQMHASLDACRKTRQEVEMTRQAEGEIAEVYEAGIEMFAAAVHATKRRAEEFANKLEESRRAFSAAITERERLEAEVAESRMRWDTVKGSLADAKEDSAAAREHLDRVRRAHVIEQRIRERAERRAEAAAREAASRTCHERAQEAQHEAVRCRDEAYADRERAALGIEDHQKGIEELTRRAAEHRMVVDRLKEVVKRLPGEDIRPETVVAAIDRCAVRQGALDRNIVGLDRDIELAAQRRREFCELSAALSRVVGADVPAALAYQRATEALAALRRLATVAEERPHLPVQLDEARAQAERQRAARAQAERLSTPDLSLLAAGDVQAAFDAAEAALREAEGKASAAAQAARDAQAAGHDARARGRELEALAIRWREVRTAADGLSSRWARAIVSRGDLDGLRAELQPRRDEVRRRGGELDARRRAAQEEASRLGRSGGRFSQALLHARDRVGGELLAGRFEEIPVDEAAAVQALLGPLHEAILVEDPRAAAEVLVQAVERPDTIWLVGGDALPELDEAGRPRGELLGRDALVWGPGGLRLTRSPEQPTLGRRARERRVQELEQEERGLAEEVDASRAEERALDRALEEIAALLPDATILEREDPRPALGAAQEAEARAAELERVHAEAAASARASAQALGKRKTSLTLLLRHAWLLDARDFTAEVEALSTRLEQAQRAEAELRRTAVDRSLLEQHLDALRVVPPSEEDVDRKRAELVEATRARDELEHALRALRYVAEHLPALAWSDAQAVLDGQRRLAPALVAQLERAKSALDAAEEHLRAMEAALREALQALQREEGAVTLLDQALAFDRDELTQSGVEDASAEALARAERDDAALEARFATLDAEERRLKEALIRSDERLLVAAENERVARVGAEEDERSHRPAEEHWQRLRADAEARGVLAAALADSFRTLSAGAGSPNLWQEASKKEALLLDRLGRARGGAAEVTELRALRADTEQRSGDAYLRVWMRARDWLLRRIPPQFAEVDEPIAALSRLRENLARLQDRLTRQEGDLRGDSSDIARNIETQIRRARQSLYRIEQDLLEVRFGNIHGVQIKLRRVEQMERVLQALKESPAQELLFQTTMPIEQALEELLSRHAGRTGGERLLDYREYVDLQVEVRRLGSASWESANPTKMSTGEAIGVGAAIMMVVLAAWERDANLLRPKRSAGTLRLLFLDEAIRLSQDNLAMLFDLCRNLELQLLIAAPEVAWAEGNTTYRLVRAFEGGEEKVKVTGRRVERQAPT